MSCFMCSPEHLTAIVSAAYRSPYSLSWLGGELGKSNAEQAARVLSMLETANAVSVLTRYGVKATDMLPTTPAKFDPTAKPQPPLATLKLLDSFEYQACEVPDYESTEAARFCAALRRQLIAQLPSYSEAPWEL